MPPQRSQRNPELRDVIFAVLDAALPPVAVDPVAVDLLDVAESIQEAVREYLLEQL
jgi:hypothetical protein